MNHPEDAQLPERNLRYTASGLPRLEQDTYEGILEQVPLDPDRLFNSMLRIQTENSVLYTFLLSCIQANGNIPLQQDFNFDTNQSTRDSTDSTETTVSVEFPEWLIENPIYTHMFLIATDIYLMLEMQSRKNMVKQSTQDFSGIPQSKGSLTSFGLPIITYATMTQIRLNHTDTDGNDISTFGLFLEAVRKNMFDDNQLIVEYLDRIGLHHELIKNEVVTPAFALYALLDKQAQSDTHLWLYTKNNIPILDSVQINSYRQSIRDGEIEASSKKPRKVMKQKLQNTPTLTYMLTNLTSASQKDSMIEAGIDFLLQLEECDKRNSQQLNSGKRLKIMPPLTKDIYEQALKQYSQQPVWEAYLRQIELRLLVDNPYLYDLIVIINARTSHQNRKDSVFQMLMGYIALIEYKGK